MIRSKKLLYIPVAMSLLIPSLAFGAPAHKAAAPAKRAQDMPIVNLMDLPSHKAPEKKVPKKATTWKKQAAPARKQAPKPEPKPELTVESEVKDLPASAASIPNPAYLSLDEAKKIFPGFEVDVNQSAETVSLRGLVHKECRGFFRFTTSESNRLLQSRGTAGIAIEDLGGGSLCMEQFRAELENDYGGRVTVRMSELEENKLFTAEEAKQFEGQSSKLHYGSLGDVRIGFLKPKNSDNPADRVHFTDFDQPLVHVSRSTIESRREAYAEAERRTQIEQARQDLSFCTDSEEDLAIARQAKEALVALGELDEDEAEQVEKGLKRASYGALAKTARTGNAEQIDELVEDLKSRAEESPEDADLIAGIFLEIAKRHAGSPTANNENFRFAAQMIREARAIDGLSASAKQELSAYQQQIDFNYAAWLASQGSQAGFQFQYAQGNLLNGLVNDYYSKGCLNAGVNQTPACMGTLEMISRTQSLRQKMIEVDQQRAAAQQMLYNTLYGQQQNATPVASNAFTPALGSSTMYPGQQQPLGMGAMPGMQQFPAYR